MPGLARAGVTWQRQFRHPQALPGYPVPVTWVIYSSPDYQGNIISATVTFSSGAPHRLISVVMYRDPACIYRKIYFGLGPDSTPDHTARHFTIPAGTTLASPAVLASFGFATITDVLAGQITAGP